MKRNNKKSAYTAEQQELINDLGIVGAWTCISFSLPVVYVGSKWIRDVTPELYTWLLSSGLVREYATGYKLNILGISKSY